jgi:hypothetical protein
MVIVGVREILTNRLLWALGRVKNRLLMAWGVVEQLVIVGVG